MERESAQLGIFICLNEPTKEMKIEVQRSPIVEIHGRKRHKLQILTVKDLIENPDLGLKTELGFLQATYEAKSLSRRPKPKARTPQELRQQPELPPMAIHGKKAGGPSSFGSFRTVTDRTAAEASSKGLKGSDGSNS